MRRAERGVAAAIVLAAALGPAGGCATSGTVRYDAEPAGPDSAAGDRLRREWSGVRVTVGPASRFPYARRDTSAAEGRTVEERGVYHLFTRVRVENRGTDTAVVRWAEARLVHPDGRRTRLVPAQAAQAMSSPLAAESARSRAGATALAPGALVIRGLLPEPVDSVSPDAPLVPLCDGCVYRLRLPVRAGSRRHTFTFPFRLVAREPPDSGFRLFF